MKGCYFNPATTPIWVLAVAGFAGGALAGDLPGMGGSENFASPLQVFGKVVLDDGTPPDALLPIQLVCHGEPRVAGYTDAKGNFNVDIGSTSPSVGDSSVTFEPGVRHLAPGGLSAADLRERDLTDCDIRASLAGFRSDAVSLGGRTIDRPEIGTIVLYRLANVEGFTVSGTSGMAPKDARNAYEKGVTCAKKKKFEQAEKEFRKAVASYPKYAVAWFALGRLLETRERPADARQAYAQALAADPKYIAPYERLSMLAVKEEKWQEVAGDTERIIHLNPYDFPGAYYYNAVAHLELGQLDAAEKSGREALEMDPARRNPKLSYLLGVVLAEKRVFTESAEFLRSFLNTLPKGPDAEAVRKQLDAVESLAQTKGQPVAPEPLKHPTAMGFH